MNLRGMWDAYGADLLGSEDDRSEFTGEQLQNILVDHVEGYLTNGLRDVALHQWREASYEQKMSWMRENFPDKELYGW